MDSSRSTNHCKQMAGRGSARAAGGQWARWLGVGVVLAIGALAAGCSSGRYVDSAFSARWSLQYPDGSPASCGGAEAAFVRILAKDVQTGIEYTDDLPCGRGRGIGDSLIPGQYEVSLQLINAQGGVITERPWEVFFIGPDGVTVIPDFVFQIQPFSFFADWDITFVGGEFGDCEAAGTPTVTLIMAPVGGGAAITQSVACADYGVLTAQVRPGFYNVTLVLQDVQGAAVSEVTIGPIDAHAGGPSDLGYIEFLVQSLAVDWSLRGAAGPSTCQAVGATNMRLDLTSTTAANVVVSFEFPCQSMSGLTGAIPIDTYVAVGHLVDAAGTKLYSTTPLQFTLSETVPATLPIIVFAVP